MERGVISIVFFKVIGVFVFVLFLGLLNFLTQYIPWGLLVSFTNFLNQNALLIIGIVGVFLFAELTSKMKFPANIFGPILYFGGTWMLIYFLFSFLEATQRKLNLEVLRTILLLKFPIALVVLSLILVLGYMPLIYRFIKKMKVSSEDPTPVEGIQNNSKSIITKKRVNKKEGVKKNA